MFLAFTLRPPTSTCSAYRPDTVAIVHELSICVSIARLVEQHADGRPVDRVMLDIGQLRQVVPETLRSSWEIVVADTDLAGSMLVIDHVPVSIVCHACGATTVLTEPSFRCACGSSDIEVIRGEELLVRSLVFTGG